jgi:hypothetical protein
VYSCCSAGYWDGSSLPHLVAYLKSGPLGDKTHHAHTCASTLCNLNVAVTFWLVAVCSPARNRLASPFERQTLTAGVTRQALKMQSKQGALGHLGIWEGEYTLPLIHRRRRSESLECPPGLAVSPSDLLVHPPKTLQNFAI